MIVKNSIGAPKIHLFCYCNSWREITIYMHEQNRKEAINQYTKYIVKKWGATTIDILKLEEH